MSTEHTHESQGEQSSAKFTRRNIIQMAGTAGLGTIAIGETAGERTQDKAISTESVETRKPLSLWYRQPAQDWETEALPLGNGRMGAMVFGKTLNETIQINEETVWADEGADHTNPEAGDYLDEIQQLLLENEHQDAASVASDHFMGGPLSIQSYQSFGKISLDFDHGEAEDYRRELDLDDGVVRVGYTADGIRYTREYFISAPDDVMAIRIETDKRGELSVSASMDRQEGTETLKENDDLVLRGTVQDSGPSIPLEGRLRAIPDSAEDDVFVSGDQITVKNTDAVTFIFTAETGYQKNRNPATIAREKLDAAEKPYRELRATHFQDHREMFRRVDLALEDSVGEPIPTDERLAAVENGGTDPHLTELYFQYGRYLLMGCSRAPGMLPANLQGIWNEDMAAPWNSDYHFNINFEMNYWPADVCNLSECVQPMMDYVNSLRKSGQKTADVHYNADGIVVHHLSDIWGFTAPADGVRWGLWPTGAAWLSRNLWEHYRKTGDEDVLKNMYPFIEEATQFMLDFLIEDKKGRLVTAPSKSPENQFIGPDGPSTLCVSPTMDIGLLHTLFNFYLEINETMDVNGGLSTEISDTISQLPPYQIGKHGQLQEWIEDYQETSPGHRHFSHLYPFHPGDQITLRETPILAAAARNAIERRMEYGSGHTGWSRAWVVNLWARFENGEKAFHHLQELYRQSTVSNLFDMHPPFQIDGNFGGTAGIAEMLVQDHADEVSLLPALPDAWDSGHITGLKARDGFEIDVEWKEEEITRVAIHSMDGNRCRIRTHDGTKLAVSNDWEPSEGKPPWDGKLSEAKSEWYWRPGDGKAPWSVEVDRPSPQVIEFDTEPGQTIPLRAKTADVPDLVIEASALSVSTPTNGQMEIEVPIRNQGTETSSATVARLVNVAPESRPQLGEDVDIPQLSAGENSIATFSLNLHELPVGKYRIWAVIDPENKVGEDSPANNVVDVVDFSNGVDLEIDPSDITTTGRTENEATISVTVHNTGNRESPATTLRLLNVTEEEPVVIAESIEVPPITPDKSQTVEFTWDRSDLPPDLYNIQAIVDPYAEVKEIDEADNAATSSVPLMNPIQLPYDTFSNVIETTAGRIGDDEFLLKCTGGELWAQDDGYSAIYLDDGVGESGEIIAKVESFEQASSYSKAGIMLRNDITKPGQSTGYAILYLFPGNSRMQWDTNNNGYVQTAAAGSSYELPIWLRISKQGSEITGYYSSDGSNWTRIGSEVIDSVNPIQDAAIFVSSNSDSESTEAVFKEVVLGNMN